MIYLVIQGNLKQGAEAIYGEYLKNVAPLMKEYGIEVELVGEGLNSKFATTVFTQNAVLKCQDLETLESFLGDERYLQIKKKYRDKAYQTLNLSVFSGRLPRH
jgi:uncharacterized protein (DUF1330 family)